MENLNDNAWQLRVQLANSSTAVLLLAVILMRAAAIQMVAVVILMTADAVHRRVYTWQV
jgi:hypothetical protein